MNPDDIDRQEIIRFDGEYIEFFGRRLLLVSLHAWEQLLRDMESECGPRVTDNILRRVTYYWGYADASAMKRSLEWDTVSDLLRAGCRLLEIAGISPVVISSLAIDEATKSISVHLDWQKPGDTDSVRTKSDISEVVEASFILGYLSGYASFCFSREIYFKRTDIESSGAAVDGAIGRDIDSWKKAGVSHDAFPRTDDIRDNIHRLAGQLIHETEERVRKRRDSELIAPDIGPYFMKFRSRQLQSVLYMADRVARFNTSVLITGESGVGKEVLSLYIHKKSPRENAPFVTVNCSALPETLLESELFGHKAGSFTGAVKDRIGLFETAENGTVFLDEIGDITSTIQLKLLRVLQEKEIVRVGENEPRKVDVRIIAATNRDLDAAISEGDFRDDLLYRLRVVEIEIPPLRERPEDILPLARFITRRLAEKMGIPNLNLTTQCIDSLQRYSWPGNVRELENAIERAAVFCEGGTIRPEDLPSHVTREAKDTGAGQSSSPHSLEEMERIHIVNILNSTGWNKSKASDILNISPSTLWRKMREYKINK